MLEAKKWNVHTTFLYQNNKIKFRITYSFVFQLRWLFTDYLTFCLRLASSFMFKRLENMYTEKLNYFLTNVDEYFRKNNHPFQQYFNNFRQINITMKLKRPDTFISITDN